MSLVSLYDAASLWMTPSGAEDGKLFSQLPTDGSGDFTFSRGSNLAATRVGADGLIEKGRENLLTYSNDFSQWTNSGTSETSGQSGYDGSSDAWLLDKTASGGYLVKGIGTSGVQTFSVYAKAGTTDWMQLLTLGSGTGSRTVFYDLTNGVIGSQSGSGTYGIDSNIESVGGGWYRCSLTFNTTLYDVRVYPAEADSVSASSGNILIQDAQLEIGLAATDYIESGATTGKAGLLEDEPRLDYSGGATCPSLLLEPSRSNLVTQSEAFSDSYWSKNAAGVVSGFISPEGLSNAYKLVEDTATTTHQIQRSFSFLNQKYSLSAFLKADERNWIKVNLYDGSSSVYAYFDLTNGVVGQELGATGKIENYGNGWYRCSIATTLSVSAGTGNISLRLAENNGGTGYVGDGTSGAYIYGFQAEVGSYPTSYIPNHSGGTVTRSRDQADNSSLNPILGNGNISVMYDFIYDVVGREGSGQIFLLYSGNNSLGIKGTQPTDRRLQLFSYGDFSGTIGFNEDVPYQTRHKVVFRVTGEVVELFYNGVKQNNTIDASALGGVYNWSRIKLDPTNAILAGLNQLAVFPTALTDSECIKLTTL